ncbi:hypothetical protein GDO81_010731 [Engystomops pustulosus]|uniref:Uncharacterized protein n=1 Tax=Engystomops pustulosus TaxID=76066 RepID=A0AAV7C388_ENGPU|nr:hypothetical protein GDO81_010731 [Engystomops pustulosus]KAG8579148.1 hypothetical protein GDO81_010731 [Engystomops pustulosus]KAG8579149.1 hypothetical protein GDO81_010731 [Engystomops pustulosus]KAG8579150.1 hypothetical protein GDO81_010731 [Engystomops pustulosus]
MQILLATGEIYIYFRHCGDTCSMTASQTTKLNKETSIRSPLLLIDAEFLRKTSELGSQSIHCQR